MLLARADDATAAAAAARLGRSRTDSDTSPHCLNLTWPNYLRQVMRMRMPLLGAAVASPRLSLHGRHSFECIAALIQTRKQGRACNPHAASTPPAMPIRTRLHFPISAGGLFVSNFIAFYPLPSHSQLSLSPPKPKLMVDDVNLSSIFIPR